MFCLVTDGGPRIVNQYKKRCFGIYVHIFVNSHVRILQSEQRIQIDWCNFLCVFVDKYACFEHHLFCRSFGYFHEIVLLFYFDCQYSAVGYASGFVVIQLSTDLSCSISNGSGCKLYRTNISLRRRLLLKTCRWKKFNGVQRILTFCWFVIRLLHYILPCLSRALMCGRLPPLETSNIAAAVFC